MGYVSSIDSRLLCLALLCQILQGYLQFILKMPFHWSYVADISVKWTLTSRIAMHFAVFMSIALNCEIFLSFSLLVLPYMRTLHWIRPFVMAPCFLFLLI